MTEQITSSVPDSELPQVDLEAAHDRILDAASRGDITEEQRDEQLSGLLPVLPEAQLHEADSHEVGVATEFVGQSQEEPIEKPLAHV